jgi:hypothetical protein
MLHRTTKVAKPTITPTEVNRGWAVLRAEVCVKNYGTNAICTTIRWRRPKIIFHWKD